VEEGFFFSRITGESGNVVRRDAKVPALVEANFADAALARVYQASMAAGVTPQRARIQVLGQFGRTFSRHRIEDGRERC
jgi:hypothetical protein